MALDGASADTQRGGDLLGSLASDEEHEASRPSGIVGGEELRRHRVC
jgi:hypothetical protein